MTPTEVIALIALVGTFAFAGIQIGRWIGEKNLDSSLPRHAELVSASIPRSSAIGALS